MHIAHLRPGRLFRPGRGRRYLFALLAAGLIASSGGSGVSAQSDPSFGMTLPKYVRQPVTAQDGNYVLNRCGALLFTMGEFLRIVRPDASDTAFQRADVYLWASAELSGRGVATERRELQRMNDVYGEAMERRLRAGGPLLTDELEADLDYCKDVEGAVKHATDVRRRR